MSGSSRGRQRTARPDAVAWVTLPFPILATITTFAIRLRTMRMRRLQAIADRTGLSLEANYTRPSRLKGDFRGHALVMTSMPKRRSSGKRRRTLVTVDMKNPEFLRLRMRRQDRAHHPFRAAEFEIGDSRFDGRFFIQSDEPVLVRDIIRDDDLRDALIRSDIYSAQAVGPTLQVVYDGRLEDPTQAELVFTAATSLADAIDGLRGGDDQNSV